MSEDVETEGAERGEAVLAIFQRGAEFTKQLLDENARLRRELGSVQLRDRQAAQSDEEWGKLRQELISKMHFVPPSSATLQYRAMASKHLAFR